MDNKTVVPTSPPLGCAAVMMEVFRGELRERDFPLTLQREAIAQILFESTDHLSADDVSAALRERGEHVGKATVYRTLGLLVELDLATEHDFDEGFKRYQMKVGMAQHDHLICADCGKVSQFADPAIEALLQDVADALDYDIITRQIKVYGTCRLGESCPSRAATETAAR
jgi:Fur family ferric uptake transcriptional regulator